MRSPWPGAPTILLTIGFLAASVAPAAAQSKESDIPAEFLERYEIPPGYSFPDLSDRFLASTRVEDEEDRFELKFGLSVLLDYTWFDQDSASIAQVGEQEDEVELRSFRLMFRGHFYLFTKFDYKLSAEYKGFSNEPGDDDFNVTDAYLATELGPNIGTLTVGKQKESHSYEMVGDAANLPHHERILSPFFRSRNTGIKLSNAILDNRATWAVGWANDAWLRDESFTGGGTSVTARLTGVPLWSEDGSRFLHLAASGRYNGSDSQDSLRYSGKPASNVADLYVDTEKFAADGGWHLGLEALANYRSLSVTFEYIQSWLDAQQVGDPVFKGWYATGSWVITGETRPYDRTVGYARRVLPSGGWGAVEAVLRFGNVDLDDAGVSGGDMELFTAALNWWATRRWKFSLGYNHVSLDRSGIEGTTDFFLGRLQWVF
jgi:phosphate-selective porin OprO/OprP